MFSVSFAVTLGILATASFLNNSRALPLPTTPLPPIPRRFIEPPFDKPFEKDLFKDGYSVDYQDVPKRPNIAQPHENVKKVPRTWGSLSTEMYDNNFYGQPQPRGVIETNSIQQDFSDVYKKNYISSYEVEGYYLDEEFSSEEEDTNFIEPSYPGDTPVVNAYYGIEPQANYPNDQYQYQTTTTYPLYNSDALNTDHEVVDEETNESDSESISEDVAEDHDNVIDLAAPIVTTSPSSKGPIKVPLAKGEQFQQVLSALNKVLSSDFDGNDSDNKSNSQKSTKQFGRSMLYPSEVKLRTKPSAIEEPVVDKIPAAKEVFSRTTTITKTTTWYLNEDNEVVVIEDTDGKRNPVKGKYTKTSKTITSGPVPWYLQGFEDVIFEEENEKSKTILDKMSSLKGMNPTSITSFTTAPNPWCTEVHEEVIFEETIKMKDIGKYADLKTNYLGSQPSLLEHIVDYFPRTQLVIEDDIIEEVEQVLPEKEEEIVEVLSPEFPPYQVPIPSPKPYVPPIQFQSTYPPAYPPQPVESENAEEWNYQENAYVNELHSGQLTNPKSLSTPTPTTIDTTFTSHPTVAPHASLDQTHPTTPPSTQPPYNIPQPLNSQHPQLYGNHPQPQNWDHSGQAGQANRREKWEQQTNNWENHQDSQHPPVKNEVLPLLPEEPTRQFPGRMEQEGKRQMTPKEPKRQLYQNRQYQNRQGRTRDL